MVLYTKYLYLKCGGRDQWVPRNWEIVSLHVVRVRVHGAGEVSFGWFWESTGQLFEAAVRGFSENESANEQQFSGLKCRY